MDGASLAVFRILFGAITAYALLSYLWSGRIRTYWVEPAFNFNYLWFGWLEPLPEAGMIAVVGITAAAAICVSIGLYYRLAAWLFLLGFSYQFLLEAAKYLNHYYAICLVGLLLAIVPAHREWSVDRLRKHSGSWRSRTVPRWSLWIVRFQVAIVYTFGGVAKFDRDWLSGITAQHFLEVKKDLPVVQMLLEYDASWVLTFGGMFFDLAVVPMLLWKKSRLFALLMACGFHFFNSQMFTLGVFPWLWLSATTIFLLPEWPRRFFHWLIGGGRSRTPDDVGCRRLQPGLAFVLVVYVAVQVIMPFRHLVYPGYALWTGEGDRFAWRMMLKGKRGVVRVFASVSGEPRREVDLSRYLVGWQVQAMAIRPDLLHSFAIFIAEEMRGGGKELIRITAHSEASLNGRPYRTLVDSTVNLAAEPRSLMPASWICRYAEEDACK